MGRAAVVVRRTPSGCPGLLSALRSSRAEEGWVYGGYLCCEKSVHAEQEGLQVTALQFLQTKMPI